MKKYPKKFLDEILEIDQILSQEGFSFRVEKSTPVGKVFSILIALSGNYFGCFLCGISNPDYPFTQWLVKVPLRDWQPVSHHNIVSSPEEVVEKFLALVESQK